MISLDQEMLDAKNQSLVLDNTELICQFKNGVVSSSSLTLEKCSNFVPRQLSSPVIGGRKNSVRGGEYRPRAVVIQHGNHQIMDRCA